MDGSGFRISQKDIKQNALRYKYKYNTGLWPNAHVQV